MTEHTLQQLVLIVEDEPTLRMVYRRVLEKISCTVLEAENGLRALELLAQYTPQIIFLDIHLPEVDGLVVLDYIEASPRLETMRVVIVTADNDTEKHARYRSFPVTFLVKPVLPEQLRRLVNDLRC